MTCSRCGRSLPLGPSWCDVCKGPVEFSARDRETLAVDVRARIMWGDPADAIRGDWLAKGAPTAAVQEVLAEALQERRRHFRIRGIQDLLIGLGFLLLLALDLWLYQKLLRGEIVLPRKAASLFIVALVILPCVSIYFLIRGGFRLSRGGEPNEIASDLG